MNTVRSTSIEGKMFDIVSPEEFGKNKQLYANTKTAIEEKNENGVSYILPYRNQNDDRPGIYDAGCVYFMRFPDEEDDDKYRKDALTIIDFSDTTSAEDFINKTQQLRNLEAEILTDIDNVFTPTISIEDTASMKLLKEAVIEKHCDISKYSGRFGDNFLNDRRLFKQPRISMDKLVSIADNLDMEVELVIRDKSPDVPNPIGKEMRAILTGGSNPDE